MLPLSINFYLFILVKTHFYQSVAKSIFSQIIQFNYPILKDKRILICIKCYTLNVPLQFSMSGAQIYLKLKNSNIKSFRLV